MTALRPVEKTAGRAACVMARTITLVEGAGHSMVGEERLDWEDRTCSRCDWTFCECTLQHRRAGLMCSFSDAPVMKD